MAHLIYYRNEREEFKEEFGKKLKSSKETEIVLKKLFRHYRLGSPFIEFTSGRNSSCASRSRVRINLSDNNFGTICHEVAHIYQAKREGFERGDHWHTKVHRRIMKRMLNYCKKKNWFEAELNRRTAPKPVKPKPTKDELRDKKIERLYNNLKRYEQKAKFYQNKIKKAKRSISALERFKLKGGNENRTANNEQI